MFSYEEDVRHDPDWKKKNNSPKITVTLLNVKMQKRYITLTQRLQIVKSPNKQKMQSHLSEQQAQIIKMFK